MGRRSDLHAMERRTPFPLSSSPSLIVISAELLSELNGFNTQFIDVLRYNCFRGAKQPHQSRVCSPLFTVLPRLKLLVAEELIVFWNARQCSLCWSLLAFRTEVLPLVTSACLFPVLFDPEDGAVRSSETSVSLYQTTSPHIQKYSSSYALLFVATAVRTTVC